MKATRYTITVTAEVVTTKILGKRWAEGGPLNRSEESNFGYTPEIESTVTEKIDVYQQTVEALDLPALVLVVNKQ